MHIVSWFKKHKVLKYTAIGLAALVALGIAADLAGPYLPHGRDDGGSYGTNVLGGAASRGMAVAPSGAPIMEEGIMPRPPQLPPAGKDAEAYEVTDYSATIETRELDKTCGDLLALKAKDYVIFDASNRYEHGCSYSFKVTHEHEAEILAAIKAMDPRTLSENTQTIKGQLDDYANQVEILQKKKASIEETLSDALKSYDQITALATKARDAESLATIIDSKVRLIERLSQSRVDINAELDQLAKAKADQMDRLNYTFFNVTVSDVRYLDLKELQDSWRSAIRDAVDSANQVLQGLTVQLLTFVLVVAQFLLYIVLLTFAAKYGWRAVKRIWKK